MGKLGRHPGLLSYEQSQALFNFVLELKPGDVVAEYDPDGGRSTVILAAAAANIGAKLYVFTDWEMAPPRAEVYFDRAVKTHHLGGVATVLPWQGQFANTNNSGELPEEVALAVVRKPLGVWRGNSRGLKPRKVLFLGDPATKLDGWEQKRQGRGWAVLEPLPVVAVPLPAAAEEADECQQ
jgi:hypothetical protein